MLLRSSSTRKSVPGQWRWRQKKFRPVLFFLDRGGLLNITAPPYASARHQTGKSTHARYAVHLYHTCTELPTSRHDNQAVEWSGFTGEQSSLCCFPCLGQPSDIFTRLRTCWYHLLGSEVRCLIIFWVLVASNSLVTSLVIISKGKGGREDDRCR